MSISTPFPKDTNLDLDYTTTVSDQTFDLSMLPRAFEGTARNQTSISTLRLKLYPKTPKDAYRKMIQNPFFKCPNALVWSRFVDET